MMKLIFNAALLALMVAAASPAAAIEEAPPTVVISFESLCKGDPGQPYCRQDNAEVGTAPWHSGAASLHHRIGSLEAEAPWMSGHIRWCEAFPGQPVCLDRPPR